MALLLVHGQPVLESAGPAWHLVGKVVRDKFRPNRLTFLRSPDALSQKINAVGRSLLPAVQLTDFSADSVVLTNAQIIGSNAPPHNTPRIGSGHSQSHDTHELEELTFTFSKIVVTNLTNSKSSSDDWTGNSK